MTTLTPVNATLKKAAKILLPRRLFAKISSIRSRSYQERLLAEWGVTQATREMIDSYGITVLNGPFRGMRYPHSSLASRNGIPILFGTYERELHPAIEQVTSNKYETIVDIGSAEGYYAVGLALRTNTPVIAFDCEPRERRYLQQMAGLNGLADLVTVRSWCDCTTLARVTRGRRCLVICDCEGYEMEIFIDACIEALEQSDLIIELHETTPGVSVCNTMLKKFQRSHFVAKFTFNAEDTGSEVPHRWQRFAREFRAPGQTWLYLTSRHIHNLGADQDESSFDPISNAGVDTKYTK